MPVPLVLCHLQASYVVYVAFISLNVHIASTSSAALRSNARAAHYPAHHELHIALWTSCTSGSRDPLPRSMLTHAFNESNTEIVDGVENLEDGQVLIA